MGKLGYMELGQAHVIFYPLSARETDLLGTLDMAQLTLTAAMVVSNGIKLELAKQPRIYFSKQNFNSLLQIP